MQFVKTKDGGLLNLAMVFGITINPTGEVYAVEAHSTNGAYLTLFIGDWSQCEQYISNIEDAVLNDAPV